MFCPKWNANIIATEFPSGIPQDVAIAALRYFLYYKHGDAIRGGRREFMWGEVKPKGPRSAPVMKTETLQKKLAERLDADPALELRMAAERLMRRKGIEYQEAKQAIMELWEVDEDGLPLVSEEEE